MTPRDITDFTTGGTSTTTGKSVKANAGQHVLLGSDEVVLKLTGGDTGGALAIVEHTMDPGTLGPPHVHAHENELSYVLDGEIGVRMGDQEFQATAGTYVFKPRGVPHAFWNLGPSRAHLLEVICPAGSEGFFADMAHLIAAGKLADSAQIARIAQRYHLSFFNDWTPELLTMHKLKPLG